MKSPGDNRKAVALVTRAGQALSTAVLKAYEVESKQLPSDVFGKYYEPMGLVPPLYDLDALAQLLEINTIHARCVRTKAQDTSGQGWEIIPSDSLSGDPSKEEYARLFDVLSNQWPPLTTTLVRVSTDFETTGNGYLECIREGYEPAGKVVKFAHVPAHTVRVHKGKAKYCQSRDNKRVWFRPLGLEQEIDSRSGEERAGLEPKRRANDLIHFYLYTSRSTYYGLPDALPALRAIVGAAAAGDYNIKFFENFGVPAYMITITGDYEPEKDADGNDLLLKQVGEYFKELQGKPHSTLALSIPTATSGGGAVEVNVESLAVDVKDASFRLYRKDNRDEVLSAHGVPPYRAGIAETGSLGGSTAEESTRIYLNSLIRPRQEMIESYFNELILPTLDVADWRFRLREVDTQREEHDIAIATDLFLRGGMTPNDLIRTFGSRFGLEPVEHPAMNAHYVNNMPIDYVPEGRAREAEAIAAVQSLHGRLVDIARKNAGN